MRISDRSPELQRADLVGRIRGASEAAGKQAVPAAPVSRADQVQISDAGRALAQQKLEGGADAKLSAERVAQIRTRILEGAYNSLDVVDQVARRMLERGDI